MTGDLVRWGWGAFNWRRPSQPVASHTESHCEPKPPEQVCLLLPEAAAQAAHGCFFLLNEFKQVRREQDATSSSSSDEECSERCFVSFPPEKTTFGGRKKRNNKVQEFDGRLKALQDQQDHIHKPLTDHLTHMELSEAMMGEGGGFLHISESKLAFFTPVLPAD